MILNKSSSFILIHVAHSWLLLMDALLSSVSSNYWVRWCLEWGQGLIIYWHQLLLHWWQYPEMMIQWPGPWGNMMPDVEQLSVHCYLIVHTVQASTIKCTIMNITWDTSRFGENIPSPFVFLVGLPLLFSGIDNKSVEDLLGSEYPNRRHISGN